ncbi:S9 family peptidase [Alloacidobacterium dinghuense]|uniref:S9 family peptidase n=1 Tax=Alloacidobacterium dinghuense TaxID=2763107 RepID=A0A7G8BML1_9BACT|nr:S9 family peptidase [Alloacidobacterium dinghuense]QNI33781.1 S9 family peptidase [Alloacidobacterium dinghuense]
MTTATRLTPPVAKPQHTETALHGHTLVDNYAWLRDKESPDTLAYLKAENDYTTAVLEPTTELQEKLYREMLSHIKETDVSVPFRDGDYWYYTRTEEGLQYPIFCRKPGSLDAPEAVILDVNKLAEGESFMAVGATAVSDDGNLLAYSVDNKGFRQYTLQVKDLRTGELLSERVERVGSIVWATDNKTLFYTVEDEEQKRQYQLFRHTLSTSHAQDVLVYEETDERFNIGAGRTRDDKYIVLEAGSHTTSEAQFLPADTPEAAFRLVAPRRDNIEYYLDHRNGLFFIRVNDTGRNFRLVTVPVDSPEIVNWTEMLPHRADVMLEEVDLFKGFYVACERRDGLQHLRVLRFSGDGTETPNSVEIAFPEPVYSAHPHQNRIFDTTTYRYAYQSLVTPSSVYEYDVTTGESKLLKQLEIPGGFDRTLYASERVFASAADGVTVPVSLVYRKDKFERGKNPLYVYGYGSYGYSLPIGFNGNRLSLLDRGFVMAYAHIRGGGDLGKPWHDAGRLMQKRNTFTDFIAAAEYLLANGYGEPGRVAMEGGSAGGLLMGAVANIRPDLFRAVISHVPFVDVMNTMLDASLPLTVPEYEEWGNPNEKAAFDYMLSYSPYDNLEAKAYPAMLVKTSLYDSQVMYWEPAKYVAKLRTLKTDDNSLLLHTNMTAGHGGASGRYDYLKEIAMDYAFLLKQLNVA